MIVLYDLRRQQRSIHGASAPTPAAIFVVLVLACTAGLGVRCSDNGEYEMGTHAPEITTWDDVNDRVASYADGVLRGALGEKDAVDTTLDVLMRGMFATEMSRREGVFREPSAGRIDFFESLEDYGGEPFIGLPNSRAGMGQVGIIGASGVNARLTRNMIAHECFSGTVRLPVTVARNHNQVRQDDSGRWGVVPRYERYPSGGSLELLLVRRYADIPEPYIAFEVPDFRSDSEGGLIVGMPAILKFLRVKNPSDPNESIKNFNETVDRLREFEDERARHQDQDV